MRLYLLRHPSYAESPGARCVGQLDLEAERVSPEQIELLAERLAPVDSIVTSDLCRTSTLGSALAAKLNVPVITDCETREVDFGEWQGRTWDEIAELWPEPYAVWLERFVTARPPGGESFHDLASRSQRWLGKLFAGDARSSICLVGHAGFIRAVVCDVLELPLEHAFRLRVDHLGLSAVELFAEESAPAGGGRYAARPPELLFLNSLQALRRGAT